MVAVGILVLGGVFYYFHHAMRNGGNTGNGSATSTPPTASSTAPFVITPSSGLVGSMVTIAGSGFGATGNTVTFNGMVSASMSDLSSPDGRTLAFAVPSSLGPNCKPDQACPMYEMLVGSGTYRVSVITNGVTQAAGSFTVTGGGMKIP